MHPYYSSEYSLNKKEEILIKNGLLVVDIEKVVFPCVASVLFFSLCLSFHFAVAGMPWGPGLSTAVTATPTDFRGPAQVSS